MVSHIDERKDGVLKPFLRWAGGKQNLLKYLLKYVPEDYMKNTYFEPFLGAGSLFLALRPRKAVISDLNSYLIHCYKAILQNPREVHRNLKIHAKKNSKIYYYRIRDLFNENTKLISFAQAARFIYLNKTCFNGIYRVNRNGFFNVPYGYKKKPYMPTLGMMYIISELLQKAVIYCMSYENILPLARKGDFIYLDPPYPSISTKPNFRHYTKERFDESDQEKLWFLAEQLKRIGCKVLISNANTKKIRHLYKEWNIEKIEVVRYITCKKKKHTLNELLITNYTVNLKNRRNNGSCKIMV